MSTTLIIFLEGTVLMPRCGLGCSRDERVRQVIDRHPTVSDYGSYIPVGDAVGRLAGWVEQGAQLSYLTSRRLPAEIAAIGAVLKRHAFPSGDLLSRPDGAEYWDVVATIKPDILIEDDCESIGGMSEMIEHHMTNRTFPMAIIVVPEFSGIDHLPSDLNRLRSGGA